MEIYSIEASSDEVSLIIRALACLEEERADQLADKIMERALYARQLNKAVEELA